MIYTQKIYIPSIALYIYACIYIGKVAISFGEATKVVLWGEGGNLPEGAVSPSQTTKPHPSSVWPSVVFHILGRGTRKKGEEVGAGVQTQL